MNKQELKELLEELGYVQHSSTLILNDYNTDDTLWYTLDGATNYAIGFNEKFIRYWPKPDIIHDFQGQYELKFTDLARHRMEERMEDIVYDDFKKKLENIKVNTLSKLIELKKLIKEQRIKMIEEL